MYKMYNVFTFFTVQEKRELSPGTVVTSGLLAKGYRLDLQVGKCRGTPFSAKTKDLLTEFKVFVDGRCSCEKLWHIKPYQSQHRPFHCYQKDFNHTQNPLNSWIVLTVLSSCSQRDFRKLRAAKRRIPPSITVWFCKSLWIWAQIPTLSSGHSPAEWAGTTSTSTACSSEEHLQAQDTPECNCHKLTSH